MVQGGADAGVLPPPLPVPPRSRSTRSVVCLRVASHARADGLQRSLSVRSTRVRHLRLWVPAGGEHTSTLYASETTARRHPPAEVQAGRLQETPRTVLTGRNCRVPRASV